MGAVKDFMMRACQFFGADDGWHTEEELNTAQSLSQLLWDLNDAATDYGLHVVVGPEPHTLRLLRVNGDESIVFAESLPEYELMLDLGQPTIIGGD